LTLGHQINIYEKDTGREVGSIHQRLLTLLQKLDIVIGGRDAGCVSKQLSLFTPRYEVDFQGWEASGDFLGWNYTVSCGEHNVLSIYKEFLAWGDTYVLDYEDPAQSLSIHLKKGRQHLDGRKALGFIRFRSGYLRADIGRLDAQKLFLAAFFDSAKALERRDIPRLAMLAAEKVKTNLRVDQMISLMRIGLDTEAEDIVLVTLPGEEVQSDVSGAWYYVLSRSGTVDVLENCFGIEGASAGFDPGHLFSNPSRREFETVYRSAILPQYYEISELAVHGIAVE